MEPLPRASSVPHHPRQSPLHVAVTALLCAGQISDSIHWAADPSRGRLCVAGRALRRAVGVLEARLRPERCVGGPRAGGVVGWLGVGRRRSDKSRSYDVRGENRRLGRGADAGAGGRWQGTVAEGRSEKSRSNAMQRENRYSAAAGFAKLAAARMTGGMCSVTNRARGRCFRTVALRLRLPTAGRQLQAHLPPDVPARLATVPAELWAAVRPSQTAKLEICAKTLWNEAPCTAGAGTVGGLAPCREVRPAAGRPRRK